MQLEKRGDVEKKSLSWRMYCMISSMVHFLDSLFSHLPY